VRSRLSTLNLLREDLWYVFLIESLTKKRQSMRFVAFQKNAIPHVMESIDATDVTLLPFPAAKMVMRSAASSQDGISDAQTVGSVSATSLRSPLLNGYAPRVLPLPSVPEGGELSLDMPQLNLYEHSRTGSGQHLADHYAAYHPQQQPYHDAYMYHPSLDAARQSSQDFSQFQGQYQQQFQSPHQHQQQPQPYPAMSASGYIYQLQQPPHSSSFHNNMQQGSNKSSQQELPRVASNIMLGTLLVSPTGLPHATSMNGDGALFLQGSKPNNGSFLMALPASDAVNSENAGSAGVQYVQYMPGTDGHGNGGMLLGQSMSQFYTHDNQDEQLAVHTLTNMQNIGMNQQQESTAGKSSSRRKSTAGGSKRKRSIASVMNECTISTEKQQIPIAAAVSPSSPAKTAPVMSTLPPLGRKQSNASACGMPPRRTGESACHLDRADSPLTEQDTPSGKRRGRKPSVVSIPNFFAVTAPGVTAMDPEQQWNDGAAPNGITAVDGRVTSATNRRFVCDVPGCFNAFINKGHLDRHKRMHTNTKPYVCPLEICGKRFTRCKPSHQKRFFQSRHHSFHSTTD
jgi:hypothetical protein